jgi:hypothetical protein
MPVAPRAANIVERDADRRIRITPLKRKIQMVHHAA